MTDTTPTDSPATAGDSAARTYVVTGAASGIGRATKDLLESRGHRVVGVDLSGSDIDADLATTDGRATLRSRVSDLAGGHVDAVIAVAGVSAPTSLTVRVNYFGAKASVETLVPLMAASKAPRVVVVTSFSALQENDPTLVDLLRADDEDAAIERADELAGDDKGGLIYASSKRAIAEWVRREAISPTFAGAGITLNAVGPGVIITPMTAEFLKTPEGRAALLDMVPMPLNGPAEPRVIADTLAWLSDAANTHITGQVLFVDGGADAAIRGPRVFD